MSNNKKKWYQRWYVWVIILGFLGGVFSKDDKEKAPEDDNKEIVNEEETKNVNAVEIKSSVLYKAYDDNEVSADNQYKDKWLRITGKIIDIRNNPVKKSETIIKLNGLIDNEYEIVGVACHFDESHKSTIASLVKGQTVTILGKCIGKPVFIKIQECSLVNSDATSTVEKETTKNTGTTKKINSTPTKKKKTISGLYMWNGLETGNFALFKNDGTCSFGIISKGGYVSSRTEGNYTISRGILTVTNLYNPNWDGASKNNGDWKISGNKSIEKFENSLGYSWFKKSRFRDNGLKIEF